MIDFKKFKNSKVLITGITGFKGSWLALTLLSLGAKVYGLGLEPMTEPSLFSECQLSEKCQVSYYDIREYEALVDLVGTIQPDFVFHLAAQALVRESVADPLYTWSTNVLGTANILNSLLSIHQSCSCVIVTSDKCYLNNEWIWGYREIDQLGGSDPYSASKAASELVFSSFFETYFTDHSTISIASARAGNVIGGGDWSSNRLIPDCIRHWRSGTTLSIRYPRATRPWQHVLEPITGYMQLALNLSDNKSISGQSFNFGPNPSDIYPVIDVVNHISQNLSGDLHFKAEESVDIKESSLLALDSTKAKALLGWSPSLSCLSAIDWTSSWYKNYYDKGESITSFTLQQINNFLEA